MDGGLSLTEGTRSVTAVGREAEGRYIGSTAIVVPGILDATSLEALACREGLALAADLNLHEIVISSDCKGLIKDIKDGRRWSTWCNYQRNR